MRHRISHEELCSLAEPEPSPEEEWSDLYRTWKQEELKDLCREVKRIEDSYLRRIQNRKAFVEQTLGIRLKVRVPRTVVQTPVGISRSLENA